jgi:predicted Fe-Mo cluster-binding NifX family protein
MGWRAAEALKEGGVNAFILRESMSPEEAVEKYISGDLPRRATSAGVTSSHDTLRRSAEQVGHTRPGTEQEAKEIGRKSRRRLKQIEGRLKGVPCHFRKSLLKKDFCVRLQASWWDRAGRSRKSGISGLF